ncbi:MAG: hypothetical protein CVT62_07435 [Actinobacteria bacterium HGW-Actinobacteria-2]|nr:MAG: hypothetical protein CVT62_07435 [Actinobacteria bacterium HGW-Actinobacteria-2]
MTGYVPPATAPAAPPSTAPTAYQPPASAPTAYPAPGYQAPAGAPAYQAPASAPAYQAPASAPAPTGYPTSGTYQAPSAAAPSAPPAAAEPWNAPPTTPVTEWTQPEDNTEEKVGRGMLFAFAGVIAGIVLAVFLWQMGFVAALTGAVMAYACVWLYGKGAGRTPRKGAIGLLLLILVGVVVSLVAAIASDAVLVARKVFPNDTARQTEAVISYITAPEVWTSNGAAVAMYLIFAALGSYSIFIGLAKARKG